VILPVFLFGGFDLDPSHRARFFSRSNVPKLVSLEPITASSFYPFYSPVVAQDFLDSSDSPCCLILFFQFFKPSAVSSNLFLFKSPAFFFPPLPFFLFVEGFAPSTLSAD